MKRLVDDGGLVSTRGGGLDHAGYVSQAHRVQDDSTIFRSLFGASGGADVCPKTAVGARTAAIDRSDTFAKAPSISAAERVKAWTVVPAVADGKEYADQDSASPLNISGMELFSETERADFEDGVGRHHHSFLPEHSTVQAESKFISAQPPFHMRLREMETRFREQMSVHQGLTRAARQIDVAHASVRQFRAERRTQALLCSIQARQEALWAQVWPDGGPPPLAEDPVLRTSRKATPAPVPVVAQPRKKSSSEPSGVASPTSDFLKDVLRTFSKPRDQRGGGGGDDSTTSRSAASPMPPGANAAGGTPRRLALTGATAVKEDEGERDDGLPRPHRVTASGVEIVPPPRVPKPYGVLRYVEVHRSPSFFPAALEVDHSPDALRQAAEVHTSEVATSPSTISEVYSHHDGATTVLSSGASSITDEVPMEAAPRTSVSGAPPSSSEAKNSVDYSSDTFEMADESSAPKGSKRRGSVMSAIPSDVEGSSSSLTDAIVEDMSDASPTTSSAMISVIDSEEDDEQGGRRLTKSKRHHQQQQLKGSTVRHVGVDEIVAQFLAACDAINAAAARLLHSPLVRKEKQSAEAKAPSPPPSSPSTAETLTSTQSLSALDSDTEPGHFLKDGRCATKPESISPATAAQPSDGAAAAAAAGWRESLERQLRNVRHLRRFRTHLIRHLERIEMQRVARCEATRLLQDTQKLSKVRQAALHRAEGADSVDVAGLLRRMRAPAGTRKAAPQQLRHLHIRARRAGESATTFDEVATEVSSAVLTENNSGIEEDIDEMITEMSESVPEVVEEEWGGDKAVNSVAVSDDISSIADDVDGRASGVDDGSSYTDSFVDETHSEKVGDAATLPSSVLDLAGVGLDEIEEELADRLAEISSADISRSSSVPSSLEKLIDLLPSSLIPSEIEEEEGGEEGGREAKAHLRTAPSVATESVIETESDTSAEDLDQRRRRTYAAVRSGANIGGVRVVQDGNVNGSFPSTFRGASSDADVDTAVPSTEVSRQSVPDGTGELSSPLATALLQDNVEATAAAREAPPDGSDEDALSFGASSEGVDALTALEMDMTLTAQRREAALRTSATVPTFEQLYNPLVPAAADSGSALVLQDSAEEGGGEPTAAPAQNAEDEDPRENVVSPAKVQDLYIPQTAAVTVQVPGSTTARAYAKEDLVAQCAWKNRQLHLLRQLRSLPTTKDVKPRDESPVEALASLQVAMDAEEAAAREEWAVHWGAVESLIHTRFASPRYEVRMTAPRRLRRAAATALFVDGTSTSSADVASRSASV